MHWRCSILVAITVAMLGCTRRVVPDGGFAADGGCIDPPDTSSGITVEYLTQQDAAWRPTTEGPMGFSVTLTEAGYDNIARDGFQPAQDQLNLLLETGAACVRIDIGFDPWLNNNTAVQADIASLVSQIRSAGKCLIVADAAAEFYRKNPLTWSAFQTAWVSRVQTLYAAFTPEFYILIKEPGWYVPMVSDARTNPAFQDLTTWTNLVQTLENAAPNSKNGVSIEGGIPAANQPEFVTFLRNVSALSGTDFIGFDQYGANDQALDLSLVSQIQTNRHIWIAEAWSTTSPTVAFDPSRACLDALWMQVEYDYAQHIGASNLIPFYDAAFSSYAPPSSSSTFDAQTPIFFVFQGLVAAHGTSVQ